jgi:protein-S-isoprenylcysteine O-methyltransferase Ste14
MPRSRPVLEGQAAHLAGLCVLLGGLFAASCIEGFSTGEFLGVSTYGWVAWAVGNAVLHQVYVWFCWRTELHAGLLTRFLGRAAFTWYAAGFTVLILARPILVTAVAISNAHTVPGDPKLPMAIGVVLAVPGVYLLFSVGKYFGFRRAYGIDHFDAGSCSAPLVRQGIFRFSPNAMYVFGFVWLWLPGLFLQSIAALAVALFSHLYIWVHYLSTERPDMRRIYGAQEHHGS